MSTLYLNNSGSRWITYTDNTYKQRVRHTWETKSGKQITRRVQYWKSFGNFAVAAIYYKGKLIKVFADSLLED